VRHLVRLIDDATRWSWGRFGERDATPFNLAVLWEYVEKNGRMVDVYTDRHALFAVPPEAGESQAERTDQERLVKHPRLAQVATLEAANAFLETEYWPEWNARFARPVAEFPNQPRPLTPYLDWRRCCALSSSV
jgi:hypothetical protein